MKKLVILFSALAVAMACKESTPRYYSSSPEIDAVKALIKDYEDGNWEAWMSHYADTAELHHNSKEAVTAEEIRDGLAGLLANVSSYGFQDDGRFYEMVIDDDGEKWVNFWGYWEGTLATNSKKLVIPVHITLQFEGGKIVEEHAYYDMSQYMAEMNAIKQAEMAEEAEAESE